MFNGPWVVTEDSSKEVCNEHAAQATFSQSQALPTEIKPDFVRFPKKAKMLKKSHNFTSDFKKLTWQPRQGKTSPTFSPR